MPDQEVAGGCGSLGIEIRVVHCSFFSGGAGMGRVADCDEDICIEKLDHFLARDSMAFENSSSSASAESTLSVFLSTATSRFFEAQDVKRAVLVEFAIGRAECAFLHQGTGIKGFPSIKRSSVRSTEIFAPKKQ